MADSHTFSHHDDVVAALSDPRWVVPPVPQGGATGTLRWLRSHVARFSTGDAHVQRRALVTADLMRMDLVALRVAAHERTIAAIAAGDEPLDALARVARRVPVEVLASALGVPDTSLDATVASVIDVAAAYHPGTGSEPVAEVAVGTLMWVLAGSAETVANRIGLLVQSCEATAGLINAAVEAALNDADRPTEDVLHDVLRDRPPVRLTRRQAAVDVVTRGVCTPAGAVIQLDLAAAQLPFGGSSRPCPGQHHAVALAAGVVDALLRRTVR